MYARDVEHNGTALLPTPVRGQIEFSHVSFGYEPDKSPVLKDVSFTVPPCGSVAFMGRSGEGKSTILNLLHPVASAKTGSVSEKTSRGRHTTRHVELFDTDNGGEIFDTPGFTSFETTDAAEDELQHYFPEIAMFAGECRFDDCRHIAEPDCAVLSALEEGRISESRYRSYLNQLEEIRSRNNY